MKFGVKMVLTLCFVVLLAVIDAGSSDIDASQLFHGEVPKTTTLLPLIPPFRPLSPQPQRPLTPPIPTRPPQLFPQYPPPQQPNSQTPINPIIGLDPSLNDVFVPYRSSRHDEFDWALTKNILSKPLNASNAIISPFLVKLLLSILSEGAGIDTSTHRELLSVLPSVQTVNQTRELYGNAFGSLLQKSDDYELNLGTKLFVDSFVQPRQRYQAIIKSFYHSDVEPVNFNNAREAANIINTWCSSVTRNYIKNIVSEDDVQRSVILLINAIYFNGYWNTPFLENQTRPLTFHRDAENHITSPFMVSTGNYYYFASSELDAKILRLPYKGQKFAMYIVLPNQINGLQHLLGRIDSSTLHRAQFLLTKEEITIYIPKFRFENSLQLNEVLKQLGIKQMFTNQASLPLLSRGSGVQDRLQVSNVLQKTGIDVNERGSTVYAATEISIGNKFGGETEFVADRPFLFLIEDETTGTLIFSGQVTRPEY